MSVQKILMMMSLTMTGSAISSCNIYKDRSEVTFGKGGNVDVSATEVDGGVSGAVDFNSPKTQTLTASESSSIGGAAVSFPPGSLILDTNISLQAAQPIALDSTAEALGIGTSFSTSGAAVSISSSNAFDAPQPFSLSLPLPSGAGLSLQSDFTNLVVIYKVNIMATGETKTGLFTKADYKLEKGAVVITTRYFGSFQTAITVATVSQKVEVAVKTTPTPNPVASASPTSTPSSTPSVPAPAVFSSLALDLILADGILNQAERLTSTSLVGMLVASGYATADFAVVAAAQTCDASSAYSNSNLANTPAITTDGSYKICTRLTNSAGAFTFGSSQSFTFNSSVALITDFSLIGAATDGYINLDESSSGSPIASFAATGSTSEGFKLIPNATTCNNSLTFGSIPNSNASEFTADGVYKICARIANSVGNVLFATSSTVVLVKTVPVFTSLALANDTVDSYLNSTERGATNDLAGSLDASGHTTATYVVTAAANSCSAQTGYGTMPKSNSSSLAADGAYKVCIKLSSAQGNVTYGESSAFTVDTASPTKISAAITSSTVTASSLTLGWNKSSDTVTSATSLRYFVYHSASNNIGTVADISTNGTLLNSGGALDISSYTAAGLSSNTTYYFNVLVKDAAGNAAGYTSISATTQQLPPVPGNSGTIFADAWSDNNVTIHWTKGSDDVTTPASLRYYAYYSLSDNINSSYSVGDIQTNGILMNGGDTLNINAFDKLGLSPATLIYFNVIIEDLAGLKQKYAGTSITTPATGYIPGPGCLGSQSGLAAVNASVSNGTETYIGGLFNRAGSCLGGGLILSKANGKPTSRKSAIEQVAGKVFAVAPDGSGGWYIGGEFKQVGAATRNNLAQINSDGTVSTWNPNVNGQVYAIATNGGTVYIGGNFTFVNNSTNRNRIAALDATTAVATSWNPNASGGVVQTLLFDGTSTVYAGGYFTTIGGQTRSKLAQIDASTGAATSWDPSVTGSVQTMVILGSNLYIGGNFTNAGGLARNHAAAISISAGAANSWNSSPNGPVNSIVLNGSKLIMGGSFTTVYATSRSRIAEIDPNIGTELLHPLNPGTNGDVNTLYFDGTKLFVGGEFTTLGGQDRPYLGSLDLASTTITSWRPAPNSYVLALGVNENEVYIGGLFNSISSQARNNIAAFDTSGNITPFNPNLNSEVRSLIIKGSSLIAGGYFTAVGVNTRSRIAEISLATGLATSWNPNSNNVVNTIVDGGSDGILIGGDFTTVGGQTRNRIAAIDPSDGLATAFNPNASSTVHSIALSGSTLYVGGLFSSIGVSGRSKIAAVDLATGSATAWNPSFSGTGVYTIAGDASSIYVGGAFTSIGGSARNNIAAFAVSTGTLESWNPNSNSYIKSILPFGSSVLVGGGFGAIGSSTNSFFSKLSASTGLSEGLVTPALNGPVYSISVFGSSGYFGGAFSTFGPTTRSFTSVNLTTGVADW